MKVRATQEFTDREAGKIRGPDDGEFNVSKTRYLKLRGMGLVEEVETTRKEQEKQTKNETAE